MAAAFTAGAAPAPDRFRPGDLWIGPDRRPYRIKACPCVRGAVSLVDFTGRHELRGADAVAGFNRERWGERP